MIEAVDESETNLDLTVFSLVGIPVVSWSWNHDNKVGAVIEEFDDPEKSEQHVKQHCFYSELEGGFSIFK